MTLLKCQSRLNLSPVEMMVLINLLGYRWTLTQGVFPRTSIIAKRLGLSERTIQRSMSKLMAKGLMTKVEDSEGRQVLHFDLLANKLARLTTMLAEGGN